MQPTEFNVGVIRPVEVYRESWALMKDQYWLMFAITIVGMLIGGVVPVILIGPMICGIYLCFFQLIDGREVKFETLFKGFDYFMKSLLVAVVVTVPVFVMIFSIYIPMIGMAIAGQRMSETELTSFLIGVGIFEVLFAVFMVCLHTLLMFAFPLIADRGLSGWAAMKTSARAVWQNLSGVVGLFGVGFLVALAGYLVFCVGIYLALPLIFMSNAVAYRKIFPPIIPPSLTPPPPTAYEGLS